jgi:DNA processing protein
MLIHNEAEIKEFENQGVTVIMRGDKRYPQKLENLSNPPQVLYCRGDLSLLTRPAIAIVGTRVCTNYGIDVAKRFARVFAENGVVVISGLADGIDTAAHLGAIEAKGGEKNTIAVLGNGVNYVFPANNKKLQESIGKNGLLISEYLPNQHGAGFHFVQRNRIVAALSSAVLIVEADLKSGTMITKDFALDLGLDVFAIPGNVTSLQSRGTNQLIKDAAVATATEPNDVLDVFGVTAKNKREKHTVVQISFEEKRILDVLSRGEVHIDELVEKISMPIPKLATLLTEMEMKGFLQKLPGNSFAALIKI